MRHLTLALLLGLGATARLCAATQSLAPENARIEFSLYALRMWPISGNFAQFQGVIVTDPADPSLCQVHVGIDARSLRMPADRWRQRATQPDMLATASFPRIDFSGRCIGDTIAGPLTLHGITRRVSFRLHRQRHGFTATGELNRRDFAIAGLPLLVGPTIKMTILLQPSAP